MVDEAQMAQTELFVCSSEPRYFTERFCSYSFPGITLHDEPVDWAAAGDHVSLTLTGMDIIKIKWAKLGFSLSNGLFLMKSFITITLNNQRFTWRMMWLPGYLKPKWCISPGVHVQTLETSAACATATSEHRLSSCFALVLTLVTSEPFSLRLVLGHFNRWVKEILITK